MFEQSDEDAVDGILRIKLGGEDKVLPCLAIEESEKWQAKFSERLGTGLDKLQPGENGQVIAQIASIASATSIDLIYDYDKSRALAPSKPELKKKLTQRLAFEVLKAIVRVEFPLAEVAPLIAETVQPGLSRLLERYLRQSFESSLSPNGASTRALSDTVSVGSS